MKKISAKQFAANQRNAQKSTGPRTPNGKASASQNSVTHGLSKGIGLLPGEDPMEFDRFQRYLMEKLNPVGASELILATQLVWLGWKLNFRGPRTDSDVAEILEFRRLQQEHLARYNHKVADPQLLGISSLSDAALVDKGQTYSSIDEPDTEARLERISRGRTLDSEGYENARSYLAADGVDLKVGTGRLDVVERRQSLFEAEAARRMALRKEFVLGREFFSDFDGGTNILEKLKRYRREDLSDFLKVSREFERLQSSRMGRIIPPPMALDININQEGR